MHKITRMLLAATCATASVGLIAVPASAQVVKGIAIADQAKAVAESSAYKNARAARPTTYKPQYDAANAKKVEIEGQLNPLVQQFQTEQQKPTPDTATLQRLYTQIQQLEQGGQQEINQILAPIAASEAYVLEQIGDKFDQSVKSAMTKKSMSIVFDVNATISHTGAYDITADVTNELNALIPNAQLVPPPGWLPRQQREAQARAAAAQGAAPVPLPEGR